MSTKSKSTKKPQRRFQFIDNSTVASTRHSSTQVRRHVMQEHMRDKRWEARSKAEASIHEQELEFQEPGQRTVSVKESPRRTESQGSQPEPSEHSKLIISDFDKLAVVSTPDRVNRNLKSIPSASDPYAWPSVDVTDQSATSGHGLCINAESFAVLAELFPFEPPSPSQTITSGSSLSTPDSLKENMFSPLSLLSAARTDPFDVLPMRLSLHDQELFDFYATVMPSCSYGFERRNPKAHNWYRDVFIPEAMKGTVTFQNTILVHAANTQAWVKKLTETPLTLVHRDRAGSMLSEHYRLHQDDASDAIITATMSAAALEDFDPRPEQKPIAWMHWAAAMHKIRQRGGPVFLESTPSLRKLVNWQDYIFSGYDGRGSSFFFTPEAIFVGSNDFEREMYGTREMQYQCEEFLTFLKCTEHLASVAMAQLGNPLARQHQCLRYSVFTPSHPLYELLASPNMNRYTESGQLKQIISRLAALMTINVAIWEYRHDTSYSELFFRELVDNIINNELHKNISVEALIQILLSGNDNPALWHFERPWLVGRLLKVAKRLARSSWERLNDFLLSCLTLETNAGLGTKMQEWEEDLRLEILRAPLVSFQLPLMQS